MSALQISFFLPFGNDTTVLTHQTSDSVEEVRDFTLEQHHLEFSLPASRLSTLQRSAPAKGKILLLNELVHMKGSSGLSRSQKTLIDTEASLKISRIPAHGLTLALLPAHLCKEPHCHLQ